MKSTTVKQFLENKWAKERAFNLRLWEEAKADVEAIAAMFIRKYNPRRIYQWGSVLNKDEFCGISDIDIGVEGAGPYPSCLICGRTSSGDPFHSVWAFDFKNGIAVLITVYRPDPERRIGWKERKIP